MRRETQKVIYFTKTSAVTPEDMEAADKISPYCQFRNASLVREVETLEPCNAVAGHVPDAYKDAYPTVKSAQGLNMVREGKLLSPKEKRLAETAEDEAAIPPEEGGENGEVVTPPANAPAAPVKAPSWAPNA